MLISSFIIIDNNGFKNRFPNYDTFSLDYGKYLKEVRLKKYELGNPQFTNLNKKNVLIIGNSHGRDTFNSLKLNEDLFFDFEFSILDTQTHCIDEMVLKSEFCNKQKMTKLQKKIFIESDILLISTSYDEDDLNELESNIDFFIDWGTPIHAVADGIVIRADHNYNEVSPEFRQSLLNKTKKKTRKKNERFIGSLD